MPAPSKREAKEQRKKANVEEVMNRVYCHCGRRIRARNYRGNVLQIPMVTTAKQVFLMRIAVAVTDKENICEACFKSTISDAIEHLATERSAL